MKGEYGFSWFYRNKPFNPFTYSISASTNNYTNNYNNGYVIIGYYDKQTVIEKVKGLKGLFL
jgi:hypothetical protein